MSTDAVIEFTLVTDATYEANAIQVRQIDEVGNISNISKNTSRIVVDTIDPIFDQQPTTIDAYVNAITGNAIAI
jgi:hypothetical protein